MEMHKLNLIILFLIVSCGTSWATPPTRTYNYVPNATIDPVQNNANENALYSYLQTGIDTYAPGSISSSDINANASISYSQLSLSNSIVNADISSTASILASKLNLTSPGPIGSGTPNTGAFSTITGTLTGNVTGNLTGNVTGNITGNLTGQALSSVSDYGTSSSSSTSRNSSTIKIAYGSLAYTASPIAVTNLPFTSSSSYQVFVTGIDNNTAAQTFGFVTINSGSQFTLYGFSNSKTYQWFAIGI